MAQGSGGPLCLSHKAIFAVAAVSRYRGRRLLLLPVMMQFEPPAPGSTRGHVRQHGAHAPNPCTPVRPRACLTLRVGIAGLMEGDGEGRRVGRCKERAGSFGLGSGQWPGCLAPVVR